VFRFSFTETPKHRAPPAQPNHRLPGSQGGCRPWSVLRKAEKTRWGGWRAGGGLERSQTKGTVAGSLSGVTWQAARRIDPDTGRRACAKGRDSDGGEAGHFWREIGCTTDRALGLEQSADPAGVSRLQSLYLGMEVGGQDVPRRTGVGARRVWNLKSAFETTDFTNCTDY
jgi:hypothetical protein